jgi:hypothetical protein
MEIIHPWQESCLQLNLGRSKKIRARLKEENPTNYDLNALVAGNNVVIHYRGDS